MTASRLRTFVFVTGALMAGAVAQAQQASQGPSSVAAAASSSSQAGSQPAQKAADSKAAAAESANAAAQKAADAAAQLIRDARNAGFKPTQIRGALMFCRTARELGSNFPVRTCYDEDQVKIKIHEYQTERNQLEQMHGTGRFGN